MHPLLLHAWRLSDVFWCHAAAESNTILFFLLNTGSCTVVLLVRRLCQCRPWVIVNTHAPFVSSWEGSFKNAECMRITYEPLLFKVRVLGGAAGDRACTGRMATASRGTSAAPATDGCCAFAPGWAALTGACCLPYTPAVWRRPVYQRPHARLRADAPRVSVPQEPLRHDGAWTGGARCASSQRARVPTCAPLKGLPARNPSAASHSRVGSSSCRLLLSCAAQRCL